MMKHVHSEICMVTGVQLLLQAYGYLDKSTIQASFRQTPLLFVCLAKGWLQNVQIQHSLITGHASIAFPYSHTYLLHTTGPSS